MQMFIEQLHQHSANDITNCLCQWPKCK